MKRVLLGTALAGTMLLTAPFSSQAGPYFERVSDETEYQGAAISPGQQNAIRNDFQQLRTYWAKSLPEVASLELELITGNDVTQCENEVVSAGPENVAAYCYTDDKIILNQEAINFFNRIAEDAGLSKSSVLRLVMAHEAGHVVQDAEGIDLDTWGSEAAMKQVELQADCYGGVAAKALVGWSLDAATGFYRGMDAESDPEHGTSAERIASFNKGVMAGSC